MSYNIAPATGADAAQLSALHIKAFAPLAGWTRAEFTQMLSLDSTLALCLNGDTGLAGLILVQTVLDTADMLTLAVAPALRRSGLARALVEAAMDVLRAQGVQRMMLDVAADNLPAFALYQTLGFAQDARRLGYYKRGDGLRVDAVLMSRVLAGQS